MQDFILMYVVDGVQEVLSVAAYGYRDALNIVRNTLGWTASMCFDVRLPRSSDRTVELYVKSAKAFKRAAAHPLFPGDRNLLGLPRAENPHYSGFLYDGPLKGRWTFGDKKVRVRHDRREAMARGKN